MFHHHSSGRTICLCSALLALVLLLAGTIVVLAAGAAQLTIEVDTTVDSNDAGYQDCTAAADDCSLRGAISKANTDLANDYTIILPGGTYTLTLHGASDDANASGDLDIAAELVLQGAGAAATTIHGDQADRVLHIQAGYTATVEGVSIVYGQAPDGGPGAPGQDGGGIYNGGVLTLTASAVLSNTSGDGGDGSGGSGGLGGYGGGIYNTGQLVASYSRIMSNTTGTGGDCDPGLYVPGKDAVAGGDGGGIFSGGPEGGNVSVVLLDVIVQGNETGDGGSCSGNGRDGGDGGYGAGVCNGNPLRWGGELVVQDSIISGNHTGHGRNCGGGSGALPGVGGSGGGIYSHSDTSVTIYGSTLTGNTLGNGGVCVMGGSGGSGGGMLISDASLVMDASTVRANACGHGATATIRGGSGGVGGGILSSGVATVTRSTISGNSAGNGGNSTHNAPAPPTYGGHGGNGGGVYSGGKLSFTSSTVSGNTAGNGGNAVSLFDGTGGNSGSGGGIFDSGLITIAHTTIATNTSGLRGTGVTANGAYGIGGGLANNSSTLALANSIVADNSNPYGAAYGIDCFNGGTLNSMGHNLVEAGCLADLTGTGDQTGVDPALDDLADNGGPTWTQALLGGSPALDAGSCPGFTADQRGYPRPMDIPNIANADDGCDIGAYEAGTKLSLLKTVDEESVEVGQAITFTIVVQNSGSVAATSAVVYDSLPAGLAFAGPISLDPPGAGTPGSGPPVLVSGLTISGGESVTVTFPVTVASGAVLTNVAAVTSTEVITPETDSVSITVANVPPVAANDAYTTTMDLPLAISAPGVLGNDNDANGDPLTAVVDSQPLSGTLAFSPDGSFTYTPTTGFEGEDGFTYHAHDGAEDSNTASVSLTVVTKEDGPPKVYLPMVLR